MGYVNGPKVLWEHAAGYYMNGTQTCNLSELMSEQARGIVLHWQAYTPGTGVRDYDHNYCFIPRTHGLKDPGQGVHMVLAGGGHIVTKYVYVSDNRITGNDNNAASGFSFSGMSIDNRHLALVEIIVV